MVSDPRTNFRICMVVSSGLPRAALQPRWLHHALWRIIREFPICFYRYKNIPMLRKIDWESQIGRRLRLRDLHVFYTVVQHHSMAKAAVQLGVSQPAVSEVISDLEHALGVRLFDRSTQGVEPTMYGNALL